MNSTSHVASLTSHESEYSIETVDALWIKIQSKYFLKLTFKQIKQNTDFLES